MSNTLATPPADKTVIIHKANCEGGLEVNAMTGIIVTPVGERPDWAAGFAVALLHERDLFYSKRLDPRDHNAHPEAIDSQDLGWIVINEDGDQAELDASPEFRMAVLAEYAGISRPADLSEAIKHSGSWKAVAEATLAFDADRSDTEARALEEATKADFKSATGTK